MTKTYAIEIHFGVGRDDEAERLMSCLPKCCEHCAEFLPEGCKGQYSSDHQCRISNPIQPDEE